MPPKILEDIPQKGGKKLKEMMAFCILPEIRKKKKKREKEICMDLKRGLFSFIFF